MLLTRRIARDFLVSRDRKTFLDIVYASKVTPEQKQMLYLSLLDRQDHWFIADKLGLEKTTIDHQIGKAYDLIYRYISNTVLVQ